MSVVDCVVLVRGRSSGRAELDELPVVLEVQVALVAPSVLSPLVRP